jgi:transposase-like protein
LTEDDEIDLAVPRDRAGSFEPPLIAKGQTRFDGFDDKILSLYARGMTVREIQGHLAAARQSRWSSVKKAALRLGRVEASPGVR